MKKTMLMLTVLVGATALVVLLFSPAMATVSGSCVSCHTMHNSQDNSGMEKFPLTETGPFAQLLRGSCVGCHAQNTGDNIDTDGMIPQIHHTAINDLAGGNLDACYNGGTADDAKGHNIDGIIDTEDVALTEPPGYDAGYDPSTVGYNTSYRLTCAGSNGCHGDREEDRAQPQFPNTAAGSSAASFAAINGAHHPDDSMLKFGSIDESTQGQDNATSYRFLYGIKGGEHFDWQNTEGVINHNEYKGAVYLQRATNLRETISELCAQCHGLFHSSDGIGDPASVWFRHPTDIILPNSGEYAHYNPNNSNLYSVEAPVGRVTIPNAVSSTVNPGTEDAIVLCISCHRAHGSDYDDILRWDYDNMNAGAGAGYEGTGCFTCHTEKD